MVKFERASILAEVWKDVSARLIIIVFFNSMYVYRDGIYVRRRMRDSNGFNLYRFVVRILLPMPSVTCL